MGKRLTPFEWTAIERQYRDGMPAKVLAAAYGISPRTIFRRASDEGWRSDAPNTRPSTLERLERLAARLEQALRLAEGGRE